MKPTARDVETVTRSIISAWLIDQVRVRALGLQRALLLLGAIGLAFALFLSGGWRLSALVVGSGCMFFGLGGMVVRALAVFGIRKLAAPKHFDRYRDEVDAVLKTADLPTTPLAALRMVRRLRRGVGTEVSRLYDLGRQVSRVIVESDDEVPRSPADDS